MQDMGGNEITFTDDGTTRTYIRTVDGMTIQRLLSQSDADQSAMSTFNGMQPG